MRERAHLLLAALIGASLLACHKDDAAPSAASSSGPTPLTLSLPQWVLDSLGPMPGAEHLTVEGVALGRHLFYEKQLSNDGTMSCSSCHVQASNFSDPRRFSVGTDGSVGTRNAMAVCDLGWSHNLFWDGRRHSLEGQAHDPVTNPIEMRNSWPVVVQRLQADQAYVARFQAAYGTSTIDSILVLDAIAQFERTLVSFNSRFDRFYFGGDNTALNATEQAGFALFTGTANCSACHHLGLMTDDQLRNNGVDLVPVDLGQGAVTGVPTDNGKFKVPTLRNITASAPYMHDGRFATLFDVVTFYGGHVSGSTPNLDHAMTPFVGLGNYTEEQKQQLIAFLGTLTDSTFLADPAFAAP